MIIYYSILQYNILISHHSQLCSKIRQYWVSSGKYCRSMSQPIWALILSKEKHVHAYYCNRHLWPQPTYTLMFTQYGIKTNAYKLKCTWYNSRRSLPGDGCNTINKELSPLLAMRLNSLCNSFAVLRKR